MKIIITKNYRELSKKAAEIVIKELQKRPKMVICFATGSTPLGLYRNLIEAVGEGKISFRDVISFNLDEYYPIKKNSKQSYYYFMFHNFFNKIDIKKQNINFLNGETKNPEKECKRYQKKLKKYKIDLQILGIGVNCHIGFNEPGSSKDSGTRLVKLEECTRKENSRFFKTKKDVPKMALTMGIKDILSAGKILLLASGKKKAKALKKMVEEPPNKDCPASFLKLHKNVIVIADKEAACLLKKQKFYAKRKL